jgi:hypothetical protein
MSRRKKNISRWFNRRRTNSTPSKFIERRRDRQKARKENKGRVPSTFGINPSLDISKAINPVNFPKVPTNDLGLKSNLPQVSLSDRPKNLNDFEEQKDIVTKLEEGTNDNETQNILDRGIDLTINVVDEVSINVPDVVNISYPKVIRGADFVGYDVDFEIKFGSINATYIKLFIGNSTDFIKVSPSEPATSNRQKRRGVKNSLVKLNVKDLIERYNFEIFDEGDKVKIPIKLIPVNEESRKSVEGLTEEIPILFDKGDIDIPRSLAINRIAEGFIGQFNKCSFDDSTYLTHLLHLGDGNNKVITTWRGLRESTQTGADASSLILKLYEPLPSEIQTNQKVWITKIQTNPIIETLTLVGDSEDYCPPLQGPNFALEVDNGIGYQVYNDLLASGSATNSSLVQKYVSNTGIDTEKLNIQYISGSEFLFDNYVHFGSAEERIKNFWYKIGLLESYQSKYNELSTTQVELGYLMAEGGAYDGYTIITEDSSSIQLQDVLQTTTNIIQANKQLDNINNLIGSFDGFENFLYTSTDDLAYPKTGNTIVARTDSTATTWYNSTVNTAAEFDRNNVDYLNNNLPEYIREDYQNEDFMLFMDMLGHHFDVIWAYINGLNNLRTPEHKADLGFSNDLVYTLLESLGWEGKKAFDSEFLWEYALGQYKNGTQKYQQSLKSANEEVWRRVLNNLPYLLKHKGTSRSLKAVMACYGVPQSLLTIMEFGGPTDPTDGGTQPFTFEDRTAALIFSGSSNGAQPSYLLAPFSSSAVPTYVMSEEETKPQTIEMNVKFSSEGNHQLLQAWNNTWHLDAIQTTGSFGKIKFSISSSNSFESVETNEYKLFDNEYKTIALTRTYNDPTSSFDLYLVQSNKDRLKINHKKTLSVGDAEWDTSGDDIYVGKSLTGSIDEFRLWRVPLEDNVIETHAKMPDATNGNNYSSSTEDLWLRFDFENPENRSVSSSIINVAVNETYGGRTGSFVNFTNQSTYPYNHEVYERSVTAQVPSLGFNQADKIRFESQTLVGDLSHKSRATKKSLDTAPVDSSRLGLFFSPIKELNMDIIKSIGNFNIDNYIGNPLDEYQDEYKDLTDLRTYYFQRLNRDIYEYIRLVRYIDKSLFDVLQDLVPARAKVSKGLLIEPHYLERNKTKWKRLESEVEHANIIGNYEQNIIVASVEDDKDIFLKGDNNQFQANIDGESDVVLTHQYDNYEANVDGEEDVVLTSTNPQYDSSIDVDDETTLSGTYPTYVSEITAPDGGRVQALVEADSFQQVGMDPNSLENAGFGLYAPIAGTGSLNTIDIFGNVTSSRKLIFKTKEQYIEQISVQTKGWPATTNSEQVEYELQNVTKTRNKVTIVPIGSTPPSVGNDITEVVPLNGYFPTHYRYKNNLSQGLKNSFFEGSKQTAGTTPDGLDPIEIFTTNPNILRVADTGRGSGEPILEVD